ncbi:MAG: YbaK/EbsC family protein [Desulfosarcina sp.]|nr:YbaK/EbsC family protein [Desulfosarcina sp.]MBC2743300.1 YbaK/EbsC family protein [Desulfosarcina sp.]MBC2766210.1 YbaK/EbsC family protein [Desulfosarcina sp.]
MTTSLNHTDLQTFIDTHHLGAAILPMDVHTATVGDAARALGVDADLIIKSLVFMAGDQPILVINNGLARVDRRKLAAYLGINRKRVKFASAEQALEISGYVVGSMPPFGHRQTLRTLVDAATAELDTVYGGGGGIDAMMRLSSSELLRVTHAEVVDISE